MKKLAVLSVAGAVLVPAAFCLYPSKPEVELTPLQRANVEALTQGEGYVEYDEYCISDPNDVCVLDPYTLLHYNRGYKKQQ